MRFRGQRLLAAKYHRTMVPVSYICGHVIFLHAKAHARAFPESEATAWSDLGRDIRSITQLVSLRLLESIFSSL
jgi:hypothetical protein